MTLEGADRLERTLADAAAALGDLSAVNGQVADLVLSRARPRVPIRTGRLVGSLRGTGTPAGADMGSSLVYAGPIHNGWPAHHITANPFITDAVRGSIDAVLDVYMGAVEDALGGVKGA